MASQERPKKLVVMSWKSSLEIQSKSILKNGYSGEKKQDFVFMGMSLVIMKEEKHRKHTICCESRFILMDYFSIFSMKHES